MVKNKLMTSMLAVSLMAMPAMVLADDVSDRVAKIKDEFKAKDKYMQQLERLETQINNVSKDEKKKQYLVDRKMVVELKQKIAKAKSEDGKTDADAEVSGPREQIKTLNQAITKYETDNATWGDTLLGVGATTGLALGGWIGYELVKPYVTGIYTANASKLLPTVLALGWRGAAALGTVAVAKYGFGFGKRMFNKIGRAVKSTGICSTVCGWFKTQE